MLKKDFGAAGDEIVIEECLEGEELSFLTFSDGYTLRSLPPAQDHKPIYNGDKVSKCRNSIFLSDTSTPKSHYMSLE